MRNLTRSESISSVLEKLGPFPMQTLETFEDLGLNDEEICGYFAISATDLARVRQIDQVLPHDQTDGAAVPRFTGVPFSHRKPVFSAFMATRASC
ncbi:hypothetical protein [Actibacterium sp. 188UL27-1]|uniref:hypothetical protein n=1 Tax=Actibacterium sp. 188UL27-1 TaxID=2786961 RepID=UPI00195869DD|nr:hypothetical protein [Actibacterium sp. 188UL27-1]MBM7067463.1 hypothetical protein [Actibacterium sp. 188UL27-1]